MFFLRGKEGSARLGRFSFPARICGRADPKRCVENVKDIIREDRSKARMSASEKNCRVDNNESDNYSDKIGKSSEISFDKKKKTGE